ncbi:PREDICTED: 50S ribosomal protein 6, chloroplastic [Ipomoea nil]|uniref:50S ribosomal protein 6, chloroplastic n=1 Tax=Ipomoea nil TaxID=35883 RepID=UPI000901D470|nr:PREDICTED: 50S ribosomal protein 6, chloroplastic [Ipomoea nil]
MSVSAVCVSRMVVLRRSPPSPIGVPIGGSPKTLPALGSNSVGGLAIECSSRPKKKATSLHIKTRPKKTQPWDVRRKGPTFYPPLPPLPPEWTLVSEENTAAAAPPEPVANSE